MVMPLREQHNLPIFSVLERDNVDFCITSAKHLLYDDSRVQEGAFSGGLYLINEDRSDFDLQFEWNLKDQFIEETYSIDLNSQTAKIILNGKPEYLCDKDILPDILEYRRRVFGYRSLALIPLISKEGLFGAIVAYVEECESMDDYLRAWFEFLAGNLVRCFDGCKGGTQESN